VRGGARAALAPPPPPPPRPPAAQEPTLPKPCITNRLPLTPPRPVAAKNSRAASTTPCPVACSRPCDPCRSRGLPVTQAGENPGERGGGGGGDSFRVARAARGPRAARPPLAPPSPSRAVEFGKLVEDPGHHLGPGRVLGAGHVFELAARTGGARRASASARPAARPRRRRSRAPPDPSPLPRTGPIMDFMACTSLRVRRSSSPSVRDAGSTTMPPLAPPKGTSMTAVFQVIREARPRIWGGEGEGGGVWRAGRLARTPAHPTPFPSDLVHARPGVEPEPALERPARIVVLHAERGKVGDFPRVPRNHQFRVDLPVGGQEQGLHAVGVVQDVQGLEGRGGVGWGGRPGSARARGARLPAARDAPRSRHLSLSPSSSPTSHTYESVSWARDPGGLASAGGERWGEPPPFVACGASPKRES